MESEPLASNANPGPKPPSNRVAIFYLGNDRLIGILEGRFELSGFPSDAKILGVHAEWDRRAIGVLVESQSFDEVPQGMLPPERGGLGARVRVEQMDRPGGKPSFVMVQERAERIETSDGKFKFREFF